MRAKSKFLKISAQSARDKARLEELTLKLAEISREIKEIKARTKKQDVVKDPPIYIPSVWETKNVCEHIFENTAFNNIKKCRFCGLISPSFGQTITISKITSICEHEFPSAWLGVGPPLCVKCGVAMWDPGKPKFSYSTKGLIKTNDIKTEVY